MLTELVTPKALCDTELSSLDTIASLLSIIPSFHFSALYHHMRFTHSCSNAYWDKSFCVISHTPPDIDETLALSSNLLELIQGANIYHISC